MSNAPDIARITAAYVMLLKLSYDSPSRTRLQSVLGGLRDEIAQLEGRSAEDVQTSCEALVERMRHFTGGA